jgi:DNA-binding HxlR family transcriptional regulator
MELNDCPVKAALDVIGGKWKPLILYSLKDRTLRFEELRDSVPGSTQKVLTEQLRQLQADGIVQRRAVPGARSHTEYSLTPYGETLRPALAALAEWGAGHRRRTAGSLLI